MGRRRLLRRKPDTNAMWGDLSVLEAEDTNRWFRRALSRWVFTITVVALLAIIGVMGFVNYGLVDAQPNTPSVTDKVQESTVAVFCGNAMGTGVAMDIPKPDGIKTIIISAAHVFDECAQGTDVRVEYQGKPMKGILKAKVPDHSSLIDSSGLGTDLARIDLRSYIPALAPAPKADMGDWAIILGNPLDRTNYATLGIISAVNDTYYETDAAANEGNSGGPMVDNKARVLGIVSSYALKEGLDQNLVQADGMVKVMRLSQACGTLFTAGDCPFTD